ncbi:MAG: hypothetical protein RL766_2069, partial [Bacteroidota bacterium]
MACLFVVSMDCFTDLPDECGFFFYGIA